ncbi:MAG: GNAT family N-acetyltransferase [Bacteroidales bacterium]|nr:GNAT family N-acetyltransferase [Bacteroidales bacterium]MBN2821201.1 GNAT family N-acetyltransferase [Bacteroidales bacterium]
MELRGLTCILRNWCDSDLESLVENANNKKVYDNLRDLFPHPYTKEDARHWIDICKNQALPLTNFAVETEGKAVGSIGLVLKEDVHRKNIEIGYWLGEKYWGRGIITEAIKLMVDYAFENFDAVRIYAEFFNGNTGSQRVLEKNGFKYEATLYQSIFKNNRFNDSKIYSLLKKGI